MPLVQCNSSLHSISSNLFIFLAGVGGEGEQQTKNSLNFEHSTINVKCCSLILILPIKVKRIVVFHLGNNRRSHLYLLCSKNFKIITRLFRKAAQTSNDITGSIKPCFCSYFNHCLEYSRLFLGWAISRSFKKNHKDRLRSFSHLNLCSKYRIQTTLLTRVLLKTSRKFCKIQKNLCRVPSSNASGKRSCFDKLVIQLKLWRIKWSRGLKLEICRMSSLVHRVSTDTRLTESGTRLGPHFSTIKGPMQNTKFLL